LPSDHSFADVIALATSAPNPLQRAEILTELGGGARDVAVLRLLRSLVGAPHPAIRHAAQEGLKRMFGQKWSTDSRPIPPPVQPPRSDD
jgi:hypothetical protein